MITKRSHQWQKKMLNNCNCPVVTEIENSAVNEGLPSIWKRRGREAMDVEELTRGEEAEGDGSAAPLGVLQIGKKLRCATPKMRYILYVLYFC